MIKFFRHIRQNLIMKNKTSPPDQRIRASKYFKYAIGEIILVVIGILIALQINNWNENRKKSVEEKALLTQLQSEFQSNIKQLNEKIEIRNSMISSSLKLLEYTDNSADVHYDSILKYIAPTILSPTFDPIVNDINSSGRIQLLTNSRLKELLSLWTSEIIQVTEEDIQWLNYRNQNYLPFLIEYGSLRNILNSYWTNNTSEAFYLDKGTKVKLNLKKSKYHVDKINIFENKYFEDHLAFCITMTKIANTQSESLKIRINELLNLIDSELKK